MEKEDIFLGSALITTLTVIWMVWPFADAILWGMFTAYFLHYFADRLNAHINNRAVTTGIMIMLLVGFVALLSLTVITSVDTNQVQAVTDDFTDMLERSVDLFIQFFDLPTELGENVKAAIDEITTPTSEHVIDMIGEIPQILINLLIYLVVAAFLVKDGKRFKKELFSTIDNLPNEYRHVALSVVYSVNQLFRGVFLTYLTVAIAVAGLASAGFYLLGIQFYWIWGLLIGLFAFFPVVSAPMVYVPLSLFYISLDRYWLGVIILAYGIMVLSILPEVLFRPYLAAHQTQEHPLILFVGFIIGPLVLGLKGVILGPMILVITKNLITLQYFEQAPKAPIAEELSLPETEGSSADLSQTDDPPTADT